MIKPTTFKDRICAAVKAFKGKPAKALHFGIEVKCCDKCDRGYCDNCYIKREYETLVALRNCNDCIHNAHSSCGFCPAPGERVRINCPLWESNKEASCDKGNIEKLQTPEE